MTEVDRFTGQDARAQELQRAFDVFNQVSEALTQAYQELQERVASLTAELAVANGELRRQYEEKQALSERLSLLLNALPAGVVVVDCAARVSEANPAAREMFGEAIIGEDWPVLAAARLVQAGTPDEWCLGERRLAVVESPLDSAGGRILLLHDVTAAHRLKADLERNQRLAAMGEMAASLAHQLRTPLATALLYSTNLGQDDLPDAARRRFAERTSAQLRRLERLIQDVLLFARGSSMGRDTISVGQLLGDAVHAVQPLFASGRVAFEVACLAREVVVVGNRKALAGALVSLLENALQACSPGARVGLGAEVAGDSLRISVSDTGSGIPVEVQERVFEPFFTTRGQGTGLGLAIALGVARAHGGSLSLRSAPGEGAEFLMLLPLKAVAGDED